MDADRTPSNLFYLAAAQTSLAETGNAEWDSRFGDFLRLDGMARADIDVGLYAAAQDEFAKTEAKLQAEYGKGFKAVPEAKRKWEEAWSEVSAVEVDRCTKYLEPLWAAARKLAGTPAPNLACALFKIELAKREELHLDSEMPCDEMSLITADMAHLSPGDA